MKKLGKKAGQGATGKVASMKKAGHGTPGKAASMKKAVLRAEATGIYIQILKTSSFGDNTPKSRSFFRQ